MTTKQRAYLRSLAQTTDPITQIGKDGVTEAFLDGVDKAIEKRELVKISVLQTSPVFAKEASVEIAEAIGATVVQVIGNRIVLYRKNEKKPKIVLPR
ncbi:MAG: YhbY family RNA-binding protein [Clostridia bacterium]|jgi:RNA-binding protein|nr:YhbY family RNA-binding protein [Clostridia bacterium]